MILDPVRVAEEHFKRASAEAALFELQLRLCAGTISTTGDLAIDTQVSRLRPIILEYYKCLLSDVDVQLIEKACTLRNKLLHCEFSAVRRHLNERSPKTRSGGIMKFSVSDTTQLQDLLKQFAAGDGDLVANTTTKTLKDTIGWLIETQAQGEFDEAATIFHEAYLLLERLAEQDAVADDV